MACPVAYITPKESYSKKAAFTSQSKATPDSRKKKTKSRKATQNKLLKPTTLTSPIYWIPQETLTFPPWVRVSGPLSSQWKRTKWVSLPWRKTEKGRPCMMVERRLLLEQFKSDFTQKDFQNLPFFYKQSIVIDIDHRWISINRNR